MLDAERSQVVREAVQLLPPSARAVLIMRFGLDGEDGRTLQEIAGFIRRSKERVRQIEAEGLALLRAMLVGIL
jgi:DNA-directed RNA polymerase sigma subunit (sigma70/sigma32)